MQREGTNMQDVRNHLEIRTLHLKIEKRILKRMGHVLKMLDERPSKIAVLGWFAELKKWEKTPGKKRKTIIYWKRLLTEANSDWTDAGRMAQDRSAWREAVMKRVAHMEMYEKQQGHHYTWEWGPNEMRIDRSEKTTRQGEADGGLLKHSSRLRESVQVKGRSQNPPGENA